MKKLSILTAAMLAATASVAFAQGLTTAGGQPVGTSASGNVSTSTNVAVAVVDEQPAKPVKKAKKRAAAKKATPAKPATPAEPAAH